jgi:hypothetical protein
MKNTLMKIAGAALLAVGMSGACLAVGVPEIDPASGANAVALIAGALLIIRGRRPK